MLIDQRRFSEWEALWDDEGLYWVPANGEDSDPAREVSLIYDNRARLHSRVERYASGKAFSQHPPPRTLHLVANVVIDSDRSAPQGHRVVRSTVQVAEARPDTRVDWVAAVTHHLVETDGRLRISFKKVLLVNLDQELTTIDFLL